MGGETFPQRIAPPKHKMFELRYVVVLFTNPCIRLCSTEQDCDIFGAIFAQVATSAPYELIDWFVASGPFLGADAVQKAPESTNQHLRLS